MSDLGPPRFDFTDIRPPKFEYTARYRDRRYKHERFKVWTAVATGINTAKTIEMMLTVEEALEHYDKELEKGAEAFLEENDTYRGLMHAFNAHSVLHVLKRAGYIRFIDKYSWE